MKPAFKIGMFSALGCTAGYAAITELMEALETKKENNAIRKYREIQQHRQQAIQEESIRSEEKVHKLKQEAKNLTSDELFHRMEKSMFRTITRAESLEPNLCHKADFDNGDPTVCRIYQDQYLKMSKNL